MVTKILVSFYKRCLHVERKKRTRILIKMMIKIVIIIFQKLMGFHNLTLS